jgi:transposase
LAHPLGLKALRKRKRVKTDPRDAYELATLLRLGSLPEAYIVPPDLRELRELVRHRRQLVKLSTSVKAGMRALLAKHNIRLAASDLNGDTATGLMDALVLPGTYATRWRRSAGCCWFWPTRSPRSRSSCTAGCSTIRATATC